MGVWERGRKEGRENEEGMEEGERKEGRSETSASVCPVPTYLITHIRVLPHGEVPSVHLHHWPFLNMHQDLVQRLVSVALWHNRKQKSCNMHPFVISHTLLIWTCFVSTHVRQEARVFPENKWLLSYCTMGTMDL